jgi:long-chain acyl-CoA synthetase
MYESNENHKDDIALLYMNKQITYRKLFRWIALTEKAFLQKGVKAGDIVTLATINTPETVYCIYALNKIRAIANMVHPLAGAKELIDYINEVNSKVVVLFTQTYEILKDYLHESCAEIVIILDPTDSLNMLIRKTPINKSRKISFDDRILSWATFISAGGSYHISVENKGINIDDTILMSHTGGTTGKPKCVMLSDRNVNSVVWQIGCNLPHERQEKMLVCLPPFVNYSLVNGIFEPLAFGFQTILLPEYKPEYFGKYVRKYRFNHINSIAGYWEALLKIKNLEKQNLSSLTHLYYGGAGMDSAIEEQVNQILLKGGAKHKLAKGYGATELTSAVTVTFDECNEPNSIGVPLVKMNLKIVEPETFNELTYNQMGEICISGPSLMKGYYKNREETENIIKTHTDGKRWLHTGDLGYVTDKGIVYLTGRIKRILPTLGEDGMPAKIFPDRIEHILMQNGKIISCCVVGKKDEKRTTIPYAYVVLNGKELDECIVKNELRSACETQLPTYMVPEDIYFVDKLPQTSRGKVDYKKLEDMINSN